MDEGKDEGIWGIVGWYSPLCWLTGGGGEGGTKHGGTFTL